MTRRPKLNLAKNNFDIHQHAMLLSMRISLWTGYKTARELARQSAETNKADSDVVASFKKLLPKHALRRHQTLRSQAMFCFYHWSLPWTNEGQRIILNTALMQFEESMRKIKAEWEDATKDFIADYPDYLAKAPKRLGALFDRSDFPDVSELSSKFSLHTSILPLPAAQDFRVNLSDAHLKRVRKEINEEVNTALQEAMKDIWQRMFTVVEKMQAKLSSYSSTDSGIEGIFRDSLVTNITELLDLLPALNVTNDEKINTFAKRMRNELTRHDADTLRADDTVRMEVASKAQGILNKMRDFL